MFFCTQKDKIVTMDRNDPVTSVNSNADIPISVLMPTCNASVPVLAEAVESILHQTFQRFEFIIIDDASTDGSWEYLTSLTDRRIRLFRNDVNLGLTKSLNIGLRMAGGRYIARMDSDDIALSERFEKQFRYMEKHPDVCLCGSRVEFFGLRRGTSSGRWRRKTENMEDYRIRLLFKHSGPHHPTFFLRREAPASNHVMYDERLICAQDYGLCAELSRFGRIVTLDDVLVRYRTHEQQVSIAHRELQIACDKLVKKQLLTELLGDVSDEEVDYHFAYSTGFDPDAKMTPEAAA